MLQRVLHPPVEMPLAGLMLERGRSAEALADAVGRFTRSGITSWSEDESVTSAPIDALELSLSRPLGAPVRVETMAKAAPAPLDAVAVAGLERVVERLSFGGDRRAGIARLELGGAWTGMVLVVRANGRELDLVLEGDRATSRELGERLAARLRSRGFAATLSVS